MRKTTACSRLATTKEAMEGTMGPRRVVRAKGVLMGQLVVEVVAAGRVDEQGKMQ
jgi:hypothetical protein